MSHVHASPENNVHSSYEATSSTHFGHQDITSERKIERRHKEHLHQYYKNIVHEINGAEHIYIFGPGKAKIELEKELKKSKSLISKIIAVETADKMTDQQIMIKVKDFFD